MGANTCWEQEGGGERDGQEGSSGCGDRITTLAHHVAWNDNLNAIHFLQHI